MSFLTAWLFPDCGRKKKIERKGHLAPTIIKLIEDCIEYDYLTRPQLALMSLADRPQRYRGGEKKHGRQ